MCQNKLLFKIELTDGKSHDNMDIVTRHAVRGITIKDDKILMVKLNRGDCKLPGGGIKEGETHEKALVREIAEEAGRKCTSVSSMIGIADEKRVSLYDGSHVFNQISHYYFVDVDDNFISQNLDDYEKDFDMTPIWISIDEAIKMNEEYLLTAEYNDWTKREIRVLAIIKNIGVDTILSYILGMHK